MPQYEFQCSKCEETKVIVRTISRRDQGEPCECGGRFTRIEIPSSTTLDTKGGWKMGAVMADGSVVQGHFGKEAPKKGPRYNK